MIRLAGVNEINPFSLNYSRLFNHDLGPNGFLLHGFVNMIYGLCLLPVAASSAPAVLPRLQQRDCLPPEQRPEYLSNRLRPLNGEILREL